MNIFQQAAKKGLTFPSESGALSVEQVYSLPLQRARGISVDSVANMLLVAMAKSPRVLSLVMPHTVSSEVSDNELRLAILKEIIADKQNELVAAVNAEAKRSQIQQMEDLLADRKNDALRELTVEELEARLASLKAGR